MQHTVNPTAGLVDNPMEVLTTTNIVCPTPTWHVNMMMIIIKHLYCQLVGWLWVQSLITGISMIVGVCACRHHHRQAKKSLESKDCLIPRRRRTIAHACNTNVGADNDLYGQPELCL